ncbi:hypothetical protein [Streptomyces sp. NPDC014744]|uniref:hypothetical protein n=1 Tax=Streptomyces sp. NPDC014744 TaxID=3364903 RepID=UPI0036F910C7
MVFPHIQMAANFKRVLLQARLPVAKVGVPVAGNGMAVVVSTDTPIAGLPQRIAAAIWSDATGSKLTPYVIVVNTDVDPMDTDAVMHAIVAKCHPARDIHVYPGFYNAPLQPYLPSGPHKALGAGGANVLFDCAWPVGDGSRIASPGGTCPRSPRREVEREKGHGLPEPTSVPPATFLRAC